MPRNGAGVFSLPITYEAVPGETILAAQHNDPLEDLEQDMNTARPVVAGGTGATTASGAATNINALSYGAAQDLTAAQQGQARSNMSAALWGHIYGLTLSNNVTDSTNDIDIAVGEAASTETNPVLITLASGITKRLDATWSLGTNQGGLDTGSIANTTYHVWLIRRPDTGVTDALFSTSATSPTMPTNYTQKRRIGSIMRASGVIRPFVQTGDMFKWATPVTDRNSTAAFPLALIALTVPAGIPLRPILHILQVQGTAGLVDTYFGDASFGGVQILGVQTAVAGERGAAFVMGTFVTNASAQIYLAVNINSGSLSGQPLTTLGWIDARGSSN